MGDTKMKLFILTLGLSTATPLSAAKADSGSLSPCVGQACQNELKVLDKPITYDIESYMEYVLSTCKGDSLSLSSCAYRLRSEVNDYTGGSYNCIVADYSGYGESWKSWTYSSYKAKYSYWQAFCGTYPGRSPNSTTSRVACESAYAQCDKDVERMADYINDIIRGEYLDICRYRASFLVTNGDSGSSYYTTDVYEGHFSHWSCYCSY